MYTLKTSVRNENPKLLQVVQAQSVSVCVCVHTGVYIHPHVCFVETVRNENLKSLQVVQAQSVSVCVCVYVCLYMCGVGMFVCAKIQ